MNRASACLCVLLIPAAIAVGQERQDPPLERGFQPDKVYQMADIDHVDLFSGGLSIVIPIGQAYPVNGGFSYSLKLSYHSDVWDMDTETVFTGGPLPEVVARARPNFLSNAGMGWVLTLGMLLDPEDTRNVSGGWRYVSADGGQHEFWPTGYGGTGQVDPDPGYWYTRDDSYLRMKETSGNSRLVEFPDGTSQSFVLWDADNHKWRLVRTQDRFGNWVDIGYHTNAQGKVDRWDLSDSQGRTHKVNFRDDGHIASVQLLGYVDPVTQQQRPATYTFEYAYPIIRRSCLDNDPNTYDYLNDSGVPPLPGENTWPILVSITLPDGSKYSMKEADGTAAYFKTCSMMDPYDVEAAPGVLRRIMMPTGGGVEWTLKTNEYHSIDGTIQNNEIEEPIYNELIWAGVHTGRLVDAYGNPVPNSTWTYTNGYCWCPTCSVTSIVQIAEERVVVVTSPDGNDTVHYFRAYTGANGGVLQWDYALPYTRRVADPAAPDRFLSEEHFQGQVTFDSELNSVGTKLRTVYRKFEYDDPGGYGSPPYRHANRHLLSERTVLQDDGDRFLISTMSSHDGFGHYRRTVTDGSPDMGGSARTTFVGFNPGATPGSYPEYPATFQMWPTSTPWVLNTYDAKEVTEGGVAARSEYCFERDPVTQFPTGFLLRMRALASGTTPGVHDTLVAYSHDAAGNVTSEQYFGGDNQSLNPGALCSLGLPSSTAYRIDHTHQYGSRATSRYVDSSGSPLPFKILDRDIDLNTGLTSRRRDTAEVATTFDYDGMGRLTWEKPQTSPDGGAWIQYLYTPASGSNPAKVNAYRYLNNTTNTLAQQEFVYDPFGRLTNERQLRADGTWSERVTTYDGMGRRSRVSEWHGLGQAAHETVYSDFDIFSRPQMITPPDGAAHQTTIAYNGVRQVQRTVKVATSRAGAAVYETDVTTTEIYDRQGRLYQVIEQKSGGTTVTTTYGYNVGGRLASVVMRDDTTLQTQSRAFTYDNRGLLVSETLPEKGTNGNGTVTYPSYDARGHLLRAIDGANDLAFTYDPAERLSEVRVTGAPGALSSFTFASLNGTTPDGTTDYVKGKLQTTSRTNADGSVVGERFYYGSVGGRVSHRDTTWPGQSARLKVSWTDLGDMASLTYPQIAGVGPARTVCSSYTNGWLVGVTDVGAGTCPGGASFTSLSYHPNGMINQVSHGNGVTDTYAKDPYDMGRPYRISTSGALSNWDSGSFEYDGAGNIKALRGTVEPVARPAPTHKAYTYDAFGNLTRVTTDDTTYQDLPTSPSTNRLTGSGYDASGNLTAWGGYGYGYDALNAMTTLTGGTLNKAYGYDADGERLSFKDVPSNTTTYSLRGLDEKVLREYTYNGSSWSWSKDVVCRQGQLLATIDSSATRHFTLDHLGSPRLITNPDRSVWAYHAYWAYGQELDTTSDTERMKFTGHERDLQGTTATTDDLDYMHARYYNPTIGRFLSVDPGRDADPKVSLGWNMYAYVHGNPSNRIDPDGLTDIHIYVYRQVETSNYMIGRYFVAGTGIGGYTIERPYRWNTPWDENERNFSTVSAIPAGIYSAKLATMTDAQVIAPLLLGTAPRTEIFMHGAMDVNSIVGCIGLGKTSLGDGKLGFGRQARQELVKYIENVVAADQLAKQTTDITVHVNEAFLLGKRFTLDLTLRPTTPEGLSLFKR